MDLIDACSISFRETEVNRIVGLLEYLLLKLQTIALSIALPKDSLETRLMILPTKDFTKPAETLARGNN